MKVLAWLALALAVWCGAAAVAWAQTPPQAIGRMNAGYRLPRTTNPYAAFLGDSITSNGVATIYQGTPPAGSFTSQTLFGNGYPGWIAPLSNLALLPEIGSGYGVYGQTSAGIAGRLNYAGVDCNDYPSVTFLYCFTGASTTAATAGGNNASGQSYLGVASTSGAAVGDNVNVSGGNVPYQATVVAILAAPSCTNTAAPCVQLSTPLTGAVTNGAAVAFSHPSLSSGFAAWLGASQAGATYADVVGNAGSDGRYSPASDPAKLVFDLSGANDAGLTLTSAQPQPLIDMAAQLDALGPKGANKIVVLADETPHGLATGRSALNSASNGAPEVVTPASGAATVSQHASYYDTVQVFYAPAGTSTAPFTAGANDGAQLTNCTTGTIAAPNGTASCTPGAGQYSVTNGVYAFNAADNGKTIAIYYRWLSNTVAAGYSFVKIEHDWVNSSAPDFVDNSVDYHIPGALYHRPWVFAADTFGALVDATTGSNYYPAPYASVDGLHPEPLGGALIANAMLAAATKAGAVQAAQPFSLATLNNPLVSAATAYASGTVSGGGACGDANKADYLGALTPAASTGIYGGGATVLTPILLLNATIIVGGVSVLQVPIDCVDQTNNLLHIKGGASSSSASLSNIVAQADASSLIANGLMSEKATPGDSGTNGINTTTVITGCGAANAYCGALSTGKTVTKGYPADWYVGIDSATQTALAANPDTILVNYGFEANPWGTGFDDFGVQVGGYAAASAGSVTLSQNLNAGALAEIAYGAGDGQSGQLLRMACAVKISAGPNGRLTGLTGVTVGIAYNTTSVFNAPGIRSNNATWYDGFNSFRSNAGSGAIEFSDGSLQSGAPMVVGGVLSFPEVTPPTRAVGAPSLAQAILSFAWNGKDPVSFTARIYGCRMGPATADANDVMTPANDNRGGLAEMAA